MKVADVFRDRAALSALLDPNDPKFVTGSEEDREQARAAWHRDKFVAEVMRSNLPEIPRSDLQPLRFGALEDTRTGDLYRARRDGLFDFALVGAEVAAYYLDVAGTPILLERPSGPKTRTELEAQQAAREQRRNAPKPRPAWLG